MLFDSTLEDYIYEVKRKLNINISESNTEWSDSFITDSVNDARYWFFQKAKYAGRDTTVYIDSVADQENYSLATKGVTKVRSVSYNRGDGWTVPLNFVTKQDFDNLTQTVESGDPLVYTVYGNEVLLYPRPSTAVTNGVEIDGFKILTKLSATTDTDSDIETDYRSIVVRYVVGLCWLEAEQESKANMHFAMAEKLFDDNVYEINSRTLDDGISETLGGYVDETDERHYSRPIGT